MSLEKAIRDMLAPKQIVEAVDPEDKGEYDNEGEMAKTQLQTMIDAAEQLRGMLADDENMPEWVQNKITKAVDYIDSARDYMKSKGDDGKAPVGEEVELDEATDLYNKGGIQIVRFAAGKGKLGVEINVKKGTSASEIGGQIILSDAQFKNLQRALPKIKLKQGLGEEVEIEEEKSVRQLIDPKKEVMVVKMMSGKRHKVIGIDKSKEKEYLAKGWLLAEESNLEEGTWALPETPKQKAALKALMKKPIKLGKNGDDASKKLYSLVGDDEVFDDLFVAGKKNPNGDARDVVKKHAKRLGLKFEELELEEMEEIVEDIMEEDKEILAALDDNTISLDDVVRSVVFEKKLDKVDPKAVKKDFKDRKDKDIDNDGDVDDSDEYLHKRRQAVSKATKKESDDENGDKEDNSDTDDNGVLKKKKKKDGEGNKGGEPIDTAPTMDESEEKMTDADMKKREEIVKELKKKTQYFKDKYGERWKDVMYATATKMAMKD